MLNIPSFANMMASQPPLITAQPGLMDWQREQLQDQLQDKRLMALLNPPMPGQPPGPGSPGPVRMALGGGLMPGMSARVGDRPSGPANPVDITSPSAGPPGTVWSAELRRWVPLKKSVGGLTTWNVADFGRVNGFGTSQGPIGSIAPGPRMSSLPGGGLMQGEEAPAPQPTPTAQDNFAARLATGNPLTEDEITAAHNFATRHQRTFDPVKGYSKGIPGYATGGPVAPGQTVRVGDKPSVRSVTMSGNRGRGNSTFTPRPETLVTAEGIQTVGQNGEEIIQPDQPAIVIPHPKSVQEALRFEQTSAGLPVAMQQRGLVPAGQMPPQGIPGVPAPRKTDLRRFGRSEAGVRAYVMQQQHEAARGQHMQDMDARDNKQRALQQADDATAQQRDKTQKDALAAEESAALDWVAEASASNQQILSKVQRDMIRKAPNAKAKSLLLSTFAQQNKAEQNAQDEDIVGLENMTTPDGGGFITVAKTASGKRRMAGMSGRKDEAQTIPNLDQIRKQYGDDFEIEGLDPKGQPTGYRRKKAATFKATNMEGKTVELDGNPDDYDLTGWTVGPQRKAKAADTGAPPPAAARRSKLEGLGW
jgi:hypothetical protein